MKNYLLIFSLVVFLTPLYQVEAVFYRNLELGSQGDDVTILQQILNRDLQTRVSSVGIGSVGQESSFFGQLTKQAVVRFQEKYKNEILTPNNLIRGNGFVGPSTRKVLLSIYNNQTNLPRTNNNLNVPQAVYVPPLPPPIETGDPTVVGSVAQTVVVSNKSVFPAEVLEALRKGGFNEEEFIARNSVPNSPSLKIFNIKPDSGRAGTQITINGSGFSTTTGNDVLVGPELIKNVKSKDGKTLSVLVKNPFPSSVEGETVSFSLADNALGMKTPVAVSVQDITGRSNQVLFNLVFD